MNNLRLGKGIRILAGVVAFIVVFGGITLLVPVIYGVVGIILAVAAAVAIAFAVYFVLTKMFGKSAGGTAQSGGIAEQLQEMYHSMRSKDD